MLCEGTNKRITNYVDMMDVDVAYVGGVCVDVAYVGGACVDVAFVGGVCMGVVKKGVESIFFLFFQFIIFVFCNSCE